MATLSSTIRFHVNPKLFSLLDRVKFQKNVISKCQIVTVAKQTPEKGFHNVKPFPYLKKRYTKLHLHLQFLDPTHLRFNQNSKIITVEGNMGSGKEEVAKSIAQAFGMHYMPEPRLDSFYINHKGFDYRTLNKYIHPVLQAIDEKMYYEDPHHPAVPWFKIFFYKHRYMQYIDALAHMLNTGQGVVLERSVHSDFVFSDAMHFCGFLPKDAYDFYYRLRYDTIHELKRPHMIIYLDTDADLCLQRIKKREIPYQVNSKVLTKKYLEEIEKSYKEHYLEDADRYSELLVFKWNNPDKIALDDMILEIENTNIDEWNVKGEKFKDWSDHDPSMLTLARYIYTTQKYDLLENFNFTADYDVDSLCADNSDYIHREEVYSSMVPNYGMAPEYDPSIGSWFKVLFGGANKRQLDEFDLRFPFY